MRRRKAVPVVRQKNGRQEKSCDKLVADTINAHLQCFALSLSGQGCTYKGLKFKYNQAEGPLLQFHDHITSTSRNHIEC